MLTAAAPAKINLTLHVTGRREDGYHTLHSLVIFADAHDRLTATCEPSLTPALSLTLGGPFAAGLSAEPDNLVLRAARALAAFYDVEPAASLHLDKHLPVASGIGGGSSDAAAALRLLVALWQLSPRSGELHTIAASLGADVPVCLDPRPIQMAGIGERLSPAPAIPPFGIVLINPGIALPTAAVFHARTGDFSAVPSLPLGWSDAAHMAADLAVQRNDLERPASSLCPALHDVLSTLRSVPTCLLARMSGSGATCFGLFATPEQAQSAASHLARPGWWCWGGGPWNDTPLYGTMPHT